MKPITRYVVCRQGIPMERIARNQREAKTALEYVAIHDLANYREYHLRKVNVWIPGNPNVVGLPGTKWQFADRRY